MTTRESTGADGQPGLLTDEERQLVQDLGRLYKRIEAMIEAMTGASRCSRGEGLRASQDLYSLYARIGGIVGSSPSTREADLREAWLPVQCLQQAIRDVAQGSPHASEDARRNALRHVHVLQHAIMAQAAGRAYPGQFRLLGEVIEARPARVPGPRA